MKAELHSHTHHSRGTKILYEGLESPETMVKFAKKRGVDIIAITDHNTTKGSLEANKYAKKYGVIVISGEEVETNSGHVLALGINKDVQNKMSVEETMENIHDQGGIGIASHPFDIKKMGMGKECLKCDAVEVFNSMNLDRLGNFSCKRFMKNRKNPVVACSDAHTKEMIGYGTTIFENVSSADDVLKAIKKSRTSVSENYIPVKVVTDWSIQRLKLSYGYVTDYINNNYSWPKRPIARNFLKLVDMSPGNIDYLFKLMAYFSLGTAAVYSASKRAINVVV